MKVYVKPEFQIIDLRLEERIASCGSSAPPPKGNPHNIVEDGYWVRRGGDPNNGVGNGRNTPACFDFVPYASSVSES